jgi:hypothetical protein
VVRHAGLQSAATSNTQPPYTLPTGQLACLPAPSHVVLRSRGFRAEGRHRRCCWPHRLLLLLLLLLLCAALRCAPSPLHFTHLSLQPSTMLLTMQLTMLQTVLPRCLRSPPCLPATAG